jgi:hypothetical protein
MNKGGISMTKKVWSVILLCVLATLLVVLCAVVVKSQILDDVWEKLLSSYEASSGISFFAGIWMVFLVWLGTMIVIFFISCVGMLLSLINIRIAQNKIVRCFSVGFLYLYFIPLFMIVIGLLFSLI